MPLCYSVVFEKLKSNGTIKGFFCFISKLSRFLLSCPSPCVSLYEKTMDIFLCPTQSPTEVMEHTGKRIKGKDRGPIKYSVGAAWPALAPLAFLDLRICEDHWCICSQLPPIQPPLHEETGRRFVRHFHRAPQGERVAVYADFISLVRSFFSLP